MYERPAHVRIIKNGLNVFLKVATYLPIQPASAFKHFVLRLMNNIYSFLRPGSAQVYAQVVDF